MIERRNPGLSISGTLIQPGEIVVTKDAASLVSITGKGVCICLWDSKNKIAGMSHFKEPRVFDVALATAKYGNVATITLVAMMRSSSPDGVYEAQLFGGATFDALDKIGAENVSVAKKVLKARNIPIVSEDTGGTKGRKILFDAQSGHVAVLKVHTLRRGDWEN
jgi:chemotaxis protein CheD